MDTTDTGSAGGIPFSELFFGGGPGRHSDGDRGGDIGHGSKETSLYIFRLSDGLWR